MGLDHDHQTRLYDEHWRPMEVAFGQEAYVRHFDGFMRYFLTVKTGELPNIGRVYEVFKEYARRRMEEESLDDVLAELHRFAGYYCSMELGQEKDPCLRAAFEDLRDLKANVAYPFLLHVYDDYMADLLTGKEMEEVVRLVESYVFRRAVCEIPTNSLNRTFESLMKVIDRDRYLESIKAALLLLPSYRRFPRDQEFRRELVKRDLYNFPRRSYWLRRLETHGRKEHVPVEEYTVEHIMPQNRNLSLAWREELGDEWEGIQGMWLHTLGNLTLTGYNAEYSDHSFSEKRDRTGGFSESPLRVNRGLGTVKRWNEEAIEARAHHLSRMACGVWEAPDVAEEVLLKYAPKEEAGSGQYTIDDHRYLAEGATMRPLFESLRSEVRKLDACVTEEFLKAYISYKAETNFVDVQAQARQLKLWLNVKFHEIRDPHGLARDVSELGHLGSGDVEVRLSRPEKLRFGNGSGGASIRETVGIG